jgi:hypothetical protein
MIKYAVKHIPSNMLMMAATDDRAAEELTPHAEKAALFIDKTVAYQVAKHKNHHKYHGDWTVVEVHIIYQVIEILMPTLECQTMN